MKKAVVVGGGITGIATALYLNKKNFNVSIFESKDKIGGILRDSQFNNEIFYSNCQYLNKNSKWMNLFFNDTFKKEFFTFHQTYSSYTDIFDHITIDNDYAMPVSENKIDLSNYQNFKNINNIDDRFSIYGSMHKKALLDFSSKYYDNLSKLHSSCIFHMQLSRLYFKNLKDIQNLKKESKIIDELFGLPRTKLFNDKKQIECSIPINGYNYFFDKLSDFLRKEGIKVFCNKTLKPVLDDPKKTSPLSLFSRKEKINADVIVWCSNPVPLIKVCNIGILDNPYTKYKSIFSRTINGSKIKNPHYIQVYSKNTNITRIYFYSTIDNSNKVTIEAIDKNIDFEKDLKFAENILKKCNFDLDLKFENQFANQKRYVLYTNDDFIKFKKMDDFVKGKNIICGSWTNYARDEKINEIYNKIDQI
tara:strand:+ start:67 stop:1323 length:1257 start_codon:yes stop_codon:yes gene_type:complete